MARNEDRIREKYRGGEEEGRATQSRYAGLEFYYTKRHLDGYVGRDASVVELGCGTGYYALHFADRCREYLGVDLVPEHVAALREKAAKRGLANVRAQLGDVPLSEPDVMEWIDGYLREQEDSLGGTA